MNKGFTLIELLMTIAILAIALAIGVPSFRTIILDNNLDVRRSVLMRHMTLARSESVERKRRVTICGARRPQHATDPDCRNDDWGDKGWIIFEEDLSATAIAGGATQGEYNNGFDTIIQRFIPDSTSITFVTSNPIRKFITYSPDGTANNQGTFTLHDNRETNNCGVSTTGRRCVVVANTGRVRTN